MALTSEQLFYTISLILLLSGLIGIIRGKTGKISIFYNYCDIAVSFTPVIAIIFPTILAFLSADRASNFANFFEMFRVHRGYEYFAWSYVISLPISFTISFVANRSLFAAIQSWCAKMVVSFIAVIAIPFSVILNILAIILFIFGGLVFVGARNKRKYERKGTFNQKMWENLLLNMFLTFFVMRWMIRIISTNLCARHSFW